MTYINLVYACVMCDCMNICPYEDRSHKSDKNAAVISLICVKDGSLYKIRNRRDPDGPLPERVCVTTCPIIAVWFSVTEDSTLKSTGHDADYGKSIPVSHFHSVEMHLIKLTLKLVLKCCSTLNTEVFLSKFVTFN